MSLAPNTLSLRVWRKLRLRGPAHSWKRWTAWSSGEKVGMDGKSVGVPSAFTKVSRGSSEIGHDLLRTEY